MNRFFLYDPEVDGFEFFATASERDAEAQKHIDAYLGLDGWEENVDCIIVGEITGRSKKCDEAYPVGEIDEDNLDENGVYWPNGGGDDACRCNYRIAPMPPNA